MSKLNKLHIYEVTESLHCQDNMLCAQMFLTLSQFPQRFLTNPSKLRIYQIQDSYSDHRIFDSVKQAF
jgi:hypothetical protein